MAGTLVFRGRVCSPSFVVKETGPGPWLPGEQLHVPTPGSCFGLRTDFSPTERSRSGTRAPWVVGALFHSFLQALTTGSVVALATWTMLSRTVEQQLRDSQVPDGSCGAEAKASLEILLQALCLKERFLVVWVILSGDLFIHSPCLTLGVIPDTQHVAPQRGWLVKCLLSLRWAGKLDGGCAIQTLGCYQLSAMLLLSLVIRKSRH